MISDCAGELRRGAELLKCEPLRKFELRFIEELFLFTKCSEPQRVTASLRTVLDSRKVDVFHNGEKVYVVPGTLNKGAAVERFRRYVGADEVIAAGDSEFDIPMLQQADVALAPCELHSSIQGGHIIYPEQSSGQKGLFADFVLRYVEEKCILNSLNV